MADCREQVIRLAYEEIARGAKIKPTTLKYAIPKTTLQRRLRDKPTRKNAEIRAQRLSLDQERFLAS
jgi:hypothetical protein